MPVQTDKNMEVSRGVGTASPSASKMEFDDNDEKIIAATLKAFESGTLTPLIKEELRCTIQSRRIAEGKGEMKVEFKTPARKKQMTDDERTRALKRRQQNREAAQRFRQRQKDTSDYLSAKIKKLEKSANALTENMNRLKEEKELLGLMLKEHMSVCSNPDLIGQDFMYTSNNDVTHTSTPTPPSSLTHQCHLSSTSSLESSFSYVYTPSTATSDTSVFFPEDAVSPVSDTQDNTLSMEDDTQDNTHNNSQHGNILLLQDNNTLYSVQDNTFYVQDNTLDAQDNTLDAQDNALDAQDNTHYDVINDFAKQNNITLTIEDLRKNFNFNTTANSENVIFYDGSLDAGYEEIIVDFADTDTDYLQQSEARTRGDSCSSVDTVSSHFSSDLATLSESTVDVRNSIASAYSQIHKIPDHSMAGFANGVHDNTDYFLVDEANS